MARSRVAEGRSGIGVKLAWTLGVVVVFRLGTAIVAPGIDQKVLAQVNVAATSHGFFGLLNLLSGGTLGKMSIFAVGIGAYIVSTMLVQLLGTLIPRLQRSRSAGIDAQSRVDQFQRYLCIPVAIIEGIGLIFTLKGGTLLPGVDLLGTFSLAKGMLLVGVWTVGAVLTMWFTEIITQKGVGQGVGILILGGVLAGFVGKFQVAFAEASVWLFIVVVLVALASLVAIVVVDQAQRRLPIFYTKSGSPYASELSYLPIKLNRAGVMPAVFALTLSTLPGAVAKVLPTSSSWNGVRSFLTTSLSNPSSPAYLIFTGLLIMAFSYAYNAATFNADDVAEGLARDGGYIHGMHPGPETAAHLERLVRVIGVVGAAAVAVFALTPAAVVAGAGITNFPITGTSLLIATIVGADTVVRLQAEYLVSRYERNGLAVLAL